MNDNFQIDGLDPLAPLVRRHLLKAKAYQSARSLVPEGLSRGAQIFLDANEWGGPDGGALARYPDPQPESLREAYAAFLQVPKDAILVGRGVDEAIELLVRTFCEPGEEAILITPPTYGYYEVAARVNNVDVLEVPLTEGRFELDLRALMAKLQSLEGQKVKLVFVCTPNNPTGNGVERDYLLELAARLSGRAILVVDEAYAEFSDRPSLAAAAGKRDNLVVLRTMSKAFGLAAARIGVAVARPELLAWMHRVRAPYPIGRPSLEVALSTLRRENSAGFIARRRRFLARERARVVELLNTVPEVEQVYPSEANFVLVRFKDAAAAQARLLQRGILVRSRDGEPGLKGCLRISIGARRDNDAMLVALGLEHKAGSLSLRLKGRLAQQVQDASSKAGTASSTRGPRGGNLHADL